MKVSHTTTSQTTFKSYYVIGRNSDSIKKILSPYEKRLNKLTYGFDVFIEDEIPLYLHDETLDNMVSLFGTKISIELKDQSINRFLQKVELSVNPSIEPALGTDIEARNIITTIKKGMELFKKFFA